ncbi:MAG: hypothetical protein HYU59_01705 [Magnetospirillum gryphiswaldense]|nr:hypothetical protein [Magnetospirillum gryphiswaldense]
MIPFRVGERVVVSGRRHFHEIGMVVAELEVTEVSDAVVVTNDGNRWRAKDGAFLKDGVAMEPYLEHGPGRTRIKLAKLLEEALGVEVHPGDLDPELGGTRVNNRGTVRWHGWVELDGGTRLLSSWHTMTECVRKGVVVTRREPDRKDTFYIVTPR